MRYANSDFLQVQPINHKNDFMDYYFITASFYRFSKIFITTSVLLRYPGITFLIKIIHVSATKMLVVSWNYSVANFV